MKRPTTTWLGRMRVRLARWVRLSPVPPFHSILREAVSEQRRSAEAVHSDEFDGVFSNPHQG
ncbi:MAG: hypothetical protein GY723_04455 [bacterium]|nr:hypothetical protein [bacterium]